MPRFFGKTHAIRDSPAGPVELAHRYLVRPGADQVLAVTNLQERDAAEAPLTAWALADRHGSVHELLAVDSAGTAHPLATIRYDALGVASVTAAPGSPRADGQPVTWTGGGFHGAQVHAATGLVELDGRWYDAAHGRYVDAGPIHTAPGRQNPYEFRVEQPLYAGPGLWESLTASFTTDDAIDLGLDAAGFIPGYGAAFDLAAAYRAWQRGHYLDAALSGVAAVPLFGDAVKLVAVGLGGAVSAYKVYQVADAAHTAARFTERTIDALRHGSDVRSSLRALETTARRLENVAVTSLPLESLTKSVSELRAAGLKDAHHVIQDAAVRDLPGYDTNLAPAVQLPGPSTARGTPHYAATQVQRESGGGTYAAERRIGYKALRRAGLSRFDARRAIQEADDYFLRIGVQVDTTTRIPGNR